MKFGKKAWKQNWEKEREEVCHQENPKEESKESVEIPHGPLKKKVLETYLMKEEEANKVSNQGKGLEENGQTSKIEPVSTTIPDTKETTPPTDLLEVTTESTRPTQTNPGNGVQNTTTTSQTPQPNPSSQTQQSQMFIPMTYAYPPGGMAPYVNYYPPGYLPPYGMYSQSPSIQKNPQEKEDLQTDPSIVQTNPKSDGKRDNSIDDSMEIDDEIKSNNILFVSPGTSSIPQSGFPIFPSNSLVPQSSNQGGGNYS